jgi:hypothetical protein
MADQRHVDAAICVSEWIAHYRRHPGHEPVSVMRPRPGWKCLNCEAQSSTLQPPVRG